MDKERAGVVELVVGGGLCVGVFGLWVWRWKKLERLKDRGGEVLFSEDGKDYVKVVHDEEINLQDVVEKVSDPGAGAIATFLGTTRDNFQGKEVVRLEYECYVPMALKEMMKICQQVRERWDVKHVVIEHRLGLCPVQQASVIIAVSSAHRSEALCGVEYAINTLKATVPIWKKEVYNTKTNSEPQWKENSEFSAKR